MSIWTTKSLGIPRDYILIKHSLPNINNVIMGVRFRSGYACVEKGSKTYNQLKKLPMLRNAKELPITLLDKLPFITRSFDVKMIFGSDVYNYYIKKLTEERELEGLETKVLKEKEHIESSNMCTYRNTGYTSDNRGELCSRIRSDASPSGHCTLHILKDPKLDLELPLAMTKEEKKKMIQKILKEPEKYIKSE